MVLFVLCFGVELLCCLNLMYVFTTRTEELTKCYEPLQKLRVRLGTCKTGLSPPVTLCYWSFQVDTSVVVLFVLCLGV